MFFIMLMFFSSVTIFYMIRILCLEGKDRGMGFSEIERTDKTENMRK